MKLLVFLCFYSIAAQTCIEDFKQCKKKACIQTCCSGCAKYNTRVKKWGCRPCSNDATPSPSRREPAPSPQASKGAEIEEQTTTSQSEPGMSKSTLAALFVFGLTIVIAILVLLHLRRRRAGKLEHFHSDRSSIASSSPSLPTFLSVSSRGTARI